MGDDRKAAEVFEVDVAGHTNPLGWVRKSIMAIPDPDPDPPYYDVRVTLRSSGRVVHTVRFKALKAAEGMGRIEDDLAKLGVDEFCSAYGFTAPV